MRSSFGTIHQNLDPEIKKNVFRNQPDAMEFLDISRTRLAEALADVDDFLADVRGFTGQPDVDAIVGHYTRDDPDDVLHCTAMYNGLAPDYAPGAFEYADRVAQLVSRSFDADVAPRVPNLVNERRIRRWTRFDFSERVGTAVDRPLDRLGLDAAHVRRSSAAARRSAGAVEPGRLRGQFRGRFRGRFRPSGRDGRPRRGGSAPRSGARFVSATAPVWLIWWRKGNK